MEAQVSTDLLTLRRNMPHWHNGLGLASVAFIFGSWAIQLFPLVRLLTRVNFAGIAELRRVLGGHGDGDRNLPFTARTVACPCA